MYKQNQLTNGLEHEKIVPELILEYWSSNDYYTIGLYFLAEEMKKVCMNKHDIC